MGIIKDSHDYEQENHYIKWCCWEMEHAKTREEAYRIRCIWCNHVDSMFDYILDACEKANRNLEPKGDE